MRAVQCSALTLGSLLMRVCEGRKRQQPENEWSVEARKGSTRGGTKRDANRPKEHDEQER
eukprot:3622556-Rhodomonas_salina.2